MGRKSPADPLARSSVVGADFPLFSQREAEPSRMQAHKPMVAATLTRHQGESVQRAADEQQVLELCKLPRGVTIDEAVVATGKSTNEIRLRFDSLEREGRIGRTATTRLTRRRRPADVWKILPLAVVSLFILCMHFDAAPASVPARPEKTGTRSVTAAWHAAVQLMVPVQRAVKQ